MSWIPLQYAFRSLIPAWRFFDRTEVSLVLQVKPKGAEDSRWTSFNPKYDQQWRELWFNPRGLSIHIYQNTLKIGCQDINDPEIRALIDDLAAQAGRRVFPGCDEFDYQIVEDPG